MHSIRSSQHLTRLPTRILAIIYFPALMPSSDINIPPQDHEMGTESDQEADEVERALIEDGVAERRMALAAVQYNANANRQFNPYPVSFFRVASGSCSLLPQSYSNSPQPHVYPATECKCGFRFCRLSLIRCKSPFHSIVGSPLMIVPGPARQRPLVGLCSMPYATCVFLLPYW